MSGKVGEHDARFPTPFSVREWERFELLLSTRLQGYACVWWAQRSDGRAETFAPRAFDWWLAEAGRSLKLVYDHQDRTILARRRDGTLAVWQDSTGLAFEAACPTWVLSSFARQIGSGAMRCSFGYRILLSRRGLLAPMAGKSCDELMRTPRGTIVEAACVHEISLTTAPAYEETALWLDSTDEYLAPPHVLDMRERWRAGLREAVRPQPKAASVVRIPHRETCAVRSPGRVFAATPGRGYDPDLAHLHGRETALFLAEQQRRVRQFLARGGSRLALAVGGAVGGRSRSARPASASSRGGSRP